MRSEKLREIRRALKDAKEFRLEHGGIESDVGILYDDLIKLIDVLGEARSMSKAVKCPICYGSGQVPNPSGILDSITSSALVTCHGCGGRGWVEISEGG